MNENFQQSGCQNFNQSLCQNRQSGVSVSTPFTFLALAAATSAGATVGYDGLLVALDTFHGDTYSGVLNSITTDGSGNAIIWNIDWTTAFFGDGQPPVVKSGPYNGFYTYQYYNFALQGKPSKIYGTLAWHKAVVSPGPGVLYEPAYSSYQADWSTRFDMQNTSLLALPPSAFLYALAFWIGKTPADLPASNFIFEDYGFGRI